MDLKINGLYHVSEYWDTKFEDMTYENICLYSSNGVSYTIHYKKQLFERRLPRVPTIWELLNGKVIEVEIKNNKVIKALIRTRYSINYCIVTVIRFTEDGILYITGWTNNINDNHKTLNKQNYIKKDGSNYVYNSNKRKKR